MALRDVKHHLSEVVDQVERDHDCVVITKHARPAAVVVSVDDLASLVETLDIPGRPRLMRQIRASPTGLAAGRPRFLPRTRSCAPSVRDRGRSASRVEPGR